MTVAAVVLAAGGGTRFRGDTHKLLAPFRGRPVVAWAVAAAVAAGLDETFVITGAAPLAGVLPESVTVVVNERWPEGQALSLAAGWRAAEAAGHDAIVVGLGDQPLLDPEAWRRVAACDAPLAVATYRGRRGQPVRLDRSMWSELPTEGDAGARALLARRPDLVREVACDGDPADIDTVEDLNRWS